MTTPSYDARRERDDYRRRAPGPSPDTRDSALLAQVLTELREMREVMGQAATKDDLAKLVSKDTYETQRTADQQIAAINAGRLTNIESSLQSLKDDFHRFQLQDATARGQMAVAATTQVDQVAMAAQKGIASANNRTAEWIARLQNMLIGALSTGVIYLLINALQHPR